MKKIITRFLFMLVLVVQIFLLSGCSDEPFIVFSAQIPKEGLNKKQLANNFK